MPNKPKERVQGCRLPSWLPQGAEAGRYVNLFPKGNTVCREKQTGKVPKPAINGKVVRFKRELCTVKANFRTAELTSIAGKFLPVEMQYAAFLALALPVYEKPIVAKAKAEKTKAKAEKTEAKATKAKPTKVHRLTKAEAAAAKLVRIRNLAKDGKIAPAEAERLLR